MLALKLLASAQVLLIVFVSNYFYRHQREEYSKNKSEKIESPLHFAGVYHYIRVSTPAFVLASYFWKPFQNLVVFQSAPLVLVGIAVSTLGLVIFVAAKLRLGENYSPCFDSYVPKQFVSSGLYRFVRHPIYTANIVLLLGLALASGSILVAVNLAVLTAYYFQAALREEKQLKVAFPKYRNYAARTGRFIPRVSALRHSDAA